MHIAPDVFTPWASLAGGLLIGAATALYLFATGRIAGISGIVAGPWRELVTGRWRTLDGARVAFVAGLLAASPLWRVFAALPSSATGVRVPLLLVAGLLTGLGVRLANGCTSGHGVCGLARGSRRSLVDVLVFMGVGALVVAGARHVF